MSSGFHSSSPSRRERTTQNILVIKHGALGDVILATGLMKAIWAHHPHARITLLTTPPFKGMLAQSNLFDRIETDPRAKWWNLKEWLRMRRFFREGNFARVYDLQTSGRTARYFTWTNKTTEWCGSVQGAKFCHDMPDRLQLHMLPRQQYQLRLAGVEGEGPDISWLQGDVSTLRPAGNYALIVPGGSAHRLDKRWPQNRYTELCLWLLEHGITPVLIGTKAERTLLASIAAGNARIANLCDRTDFGQVAELARHAAFSIGNDTGPMHIIAATGCPSLVLFSHASDPALSAPPGEHVHVLREPHLASLSVRMVTAKVSDAFGLTAATP